MSDKHLRSEKRGRAIRWRHDRDGMIIETVIIPNKHPIPDGLVEEMKRQLLRESHKQRTSSLVTTLTNLIARNELDRAAPPRWARLVLWYLLEPKTRDALMGDLEEDFWAAAEEFGIHEARRWYGWQALRSCGPWIGGFFYRMLDAVLGASKGAK